MNTWNGFDFFIFLIFALNMLLGMSRGATKEIISFMCLSLALIITIKFTVPLANFFNSSPLISDVIDNKNIHYFMVAIGAGPLTAGLLHQLFYSISMLICFVGTFSATEAVLSYSGFLEAFGFAYATLNRKVGAGLGVVRGYVISLLVIAILAFHIFQSANPSFLTNSFFVNLFRGSAVRLDSIIAGQQPDSYKDIYKDKDLFKTQDIYNKLQGETQTAPAQTQ